jgi:hypothetical protein
MKKIVQSSILIWQLQFINVVINFFEYFKRIQITIRQFLLKFSHTNILCGQKYFIVKFKNYFFPFNIIIFFSNFLCFNLENLIRSIIYILYFNLLSCYGYLFWSVTVRSGGIHTKCKFKPINYAERNFPDYFINVIVELILRWRE